MSTLLYFMIGYFIAKWAGSDYEIETFEEIIAIILWPLVLFVMVIGKL